MKKSITISLPQVASEMLVEFCKACEVTEEEALRIAIFHLLGSWEFDKQQQGEKCISG